MSQKRQPDVYELVEALKNEINKFGELTPLNPIYRYFRRAVVGKKRVLFKSDVMYRARLVLTNENKDDGQDIEGEDFDFDGGDAKDGGDGAEKDLSGEDGSEDVVNKDAYENADGSPESDGEAPNFILSEDEIIPEETPEKEAKDDGEPDFSKDRIETEKVVATKETEEKEKNVYDADNPHRKLSKLLFAAQDPLTAIGEYRRLRFEECILDELHLLRKKKLADFTDITSNTTSVPGSINRYLSLYFSLYLFDINSNFYKPARYILEYIMNQKLDGIAYRNNYDRKINYILFSPRGLMMGSSRSMQIEPPPRIEEE